MDLQAVAGSIVLGSRKLKVPLCGQSFLRGQGRCDYRQGRKPFHCMCPPPCGDPKRNLLEGEACTWRAHVDTREGECRWSRGASGGEIGIRGTLHMCVIVSHFHIHRGFRCWQLETWGQIAQLGLDQHSGHSLKASAWVRAP